MSGVAAKDWHFGVNSRSSLIPAAGTASCLDCHTRRQDSQTRCYGISRPLAEPAYHKQPCSPADPSYLAISCC
jgi:hypothetical protein